MRFPRMSGDEHTVRATLVPAAARSGFLPVLVLLLGLYLVAPWVVGKPWGQSAVIAGACLMLVLAARAAGGRWWVLLATQAAPVTLLAAHSLLYAAGSTRLAAVEHVTFALLVLVALTLTLRNKVLRAHQVGADEIYAAVTAYLLLGLWWASWYAFLDSLHLDPPAFSQDLAARDAAHGIAGNFGAALYYSYVTLTTLGYGDILPVHRVARSLATLEALTGQLYIAVVMARLITMHTSRPNGADRRRD